MGINVVKLEDIANIDYGTRVVKSKVEGNEYPVYGGGGETFRINKYNRENCVVISRFAMSPKCTRYVNEKIFLNDSGLTVSTKDNSKLLQEYLDWYILSKNDEIYSLGRGAGQRNLEIPSFKRMLISYPTNLEEQQKIISQLKLADEIRTKKRLANDKLDEFLKSTFISMFGDPIKNNKNWSRHKMETLMTIKRGGSPRPIEKFLGGEYHWIKIGDATKNSSIYIYNTKEKIIKEGLNKTTFLPKGSLIFANCGVSLGFARILKIDGCIHDGWLSFSDIDETLNKIFLLKTLNHITEYFRKIAPDGTQPNLNTSIMKNFEVIVPPIEEQNKFAQIVEKVEAQKQKNEQIVEQMDNLFNSLSQRAFKGEL